VRENETSLRKWSGGTAQLRTSGEALDCDRDYFAEVSMDRIRIGCPTWYLRFFPIRIGFGYTFLKKIGSGYWFDFYNESFLRVIQDVTNDDSSVFFAMLFILSVCAALITINGKSCYFIVNFFRPSGSSELLLYCWHGRSFVIKCEGTPWCETNIVIGTMQKWRFLYTDSQSYF